MLKLSIRKQTSRTARALTVAGNPAVSTAESCVGYWYYKWRALSGREGESLRQMRILHIFPTFDIGGPQVRTALLINQLGTDYEHVILPLNGAVAASARINEGTRVSFLSVPPRGNEFAQTVNARRLIKGTNPDLVTTYNWGAMNAVAAALIAGYPVVHAEDGFGTDEAQALRTRRVLTRRLLLPHAVATVVPSRTLEEIALRRYRIPAEKVRFIPNGVDTERFRPNLGRKWRQQYGIPDDAIVVGYLGRLGPEKNLKLLIRAFEEARLENARLVLAGDGPERGALEQAAGENVIFTGQLDDPAPVYSSLDIFSLSSVTEQMSISLLEAMACGLPCACTDVGDNRYLLDESDAPAIVPPSDSAALAAALRLLAGNAGLRHRLGTRNRSRCEEVYPLSAMVGAYRSLYEEAAVRCGASAASFAV